MSYLLSKIILIYVPSKKGSRRGRRKIYMVTPTDRIKNPKKGGRENMNTQFTGSIGIVLEDEYIIVVRDPVKFPSGTTGTYLRIFERSGLDGPDGIIYLRMVFVMLHVTGNWNVLSEAVKQEITEEFGFIKLTEGFSKSMLSSKITKGG